MFFCCFEYDCQKFFQKFFKKIFKKTFVKIIQKSYLFDKLSKLDEKFNRGENEKIVVVEFFVFSTIENYEKMFDVKKIQFVDILNRQTMKIANRRDESIRLISQSLIFRFETSRNTRDSITIEIKFFFFYFFVEFEFFVVASRYFSRIRFLDKIIISFIENDKTKIDEIFITNEKSVQNFFFRISIFSIFLSFTTFISIQSRAAIFEIVKKINQFFVNFVQ